MHLNGEKMDDFEIIKAARKLLAETPMSKASTATYADYKQKVRCLVARVQRSDNLESSFSLLIAEALKTSKKSTWQAMRAALIYAARVGLENFLKTQDALQRGNKAIILLGKSVDLSSWKSEVAKVEQWQQALEEVLNAKLPLEGRVARHTKKQDMRGLPSNWREEIITRMPKYKYAAMACAVTGCRPAELVNGVSLVIQDGMMIARIKGVKVDIAGGRGQEWRELRWPLSHENSLVNELVIATQLAGGSMIVSIANASNFSKAMSNAGTRIWPRRKTSITPYCMRHQAAADMKASGELSSSDISAALGHVSDVTKSTYGHLRMGKRGGVAPSSVLAARPVKTSEVSKYIRSKTLKLNKP